MPLVQINLLYIDQGIRFIEISGFPPREGKLIKT